MTGLLSAKQPSSNAFTACATHAFTVPSNCRLPTRGKCPRDAVMIILSQSSMLRSFSMPISKGSGIISTCSIPLRAASIARHGAAASGSNQTRFAVKGAASTRGAVGAGSRCAGPAVAGGTTNPTVQEMMRPHSLSSKRDGTAANAVVVAQPWLNSRKAVIISPGEDFSALSSIPIANVPCVAAVELKSA